MRKTSMYVIFGYDYAYEKGHRPGSAVLNGWGYGCCGPRDIFRADQCFTSKNKAKSYIQKALRERKLPGGRMRPDVNYSNYEIRQVYRCKNSKNTYVLNKKDLHL